MGNGSSAYIIDIAAEVKQHRLGELAPVDTVVLAELVIRECSRVHFQEHPPVIRTSLEHISTKRDEVVQGRKHL